MLAAFGAPFAAASPIAQDLTSKEGIQAYIASISPVDASTVEKVIECESGYKQAAIGDHGLAKGIAQFHEETFYRMQRLSHINPQARWPDERTELQLLIWAVDNGHASEWTCFRTLK